MDSKSRRTPSTRRQPRRVRGRWWPATCSVALVLVLSPALADPDDEEKILQESLQRIETAFRTQDARRLRPLLPVLAKVLVDLQSFSQPKAYYAPDQVVMILGKIFEEIRVVQFHLERDRRPARPAELIRIAATWQYRGEASGLREERLQFLIRREENGYFIREIKEVG